MPRAHKVLGQAAPTGTSDTTLYTVPASTQAIVSSIVLANITATAATFRVAVRPAGATIIANQHYLAYDVTLGGNDSTTLTLGIALATTDVITVRSGTANAIAFTAFGVEIT